MTWELTKELDVQTPFHKPITEKQFEETIKPFRVTLSKQQINEARIYWTGIMEYQI